MEAFPAQDPKEFLGFIQALNARGGHPERLDRHMRVNPSARHFETVRPGRPESFAALRYHMLHPYRLTGEDGTAVVGRLIVVGVDVPEPNREGPAGADYLDQELRRRLDLTPVELSLEFHPTSGVERPEDVSAPWCNQAGIVTLGHVTIERLASDQSLQRSLFFDPSRLPDGVAFAGDPMIEARLQAYQLAAKRRFSSLVGRGKNNR